jgi:murein DD-endopeptidase MepM/ murein hydrolase activator NlpD
MRHLKTFALAAVLGAAPAAAQTADADSARMRTGRTYTRWFYEGKVDSLWARFHPVMHELVPGPPKLAAFRAETVGQWGAEAEVLSESARMESGATLYTREMRFASAPGRFEIVWATLPDGRVIGFTAGSADTTRTAAAAQAAPPAPSRFLEYTTRTPLRLPFDGEWYVGWGGRTVEQNYHAATSDQRFAYDLLVQRGGMTHDGDGKALEQYYCWGLPILAPGAGTVATALDGLPDQPIGRMDRANPPGNHVVLDHGNGEFSLLAHLRNGSVAVKAGDRVRAGAKLGECGNSGNSSEPHLHYHLQNTAVFGRGEGLPAQFQGYVADGRPVERGEPVQGQTIRPRG